MHRPGIAALSIVSLLLAGGVLVGDDAERLPPPAGSASRVSGETLPSVEELIGGDAVLSEETSGGEDVNDDLLLDDSAGPPLGGGQELLLDGAGAARGPAGGGPVGGGEGLLDGSDPLGSDPLGSDAVGGDPLESIGPSRQSNRGSEPAAREPDPHEAIWTEGCYPSAETCRKCHPKQYEEWRASGHAYSAISPMFTRFEQAMIDLTRGTVGSFCMRCHSPVGTQMKVPRASSMLDAPAIVREGVTCVACHRVREHYWRSNGDRRIEPGDIHQPVYGGKGGAGVAAAIAKADEYKLKLESSDTGPGQRIHREGRFFKPITNSDLCVSCHQVAVHPGIWLEVVHAQYRSGPAAKKGISCQDCHMGAVPGKPLGYEHCHTAELGGKPYGEPQRHGNHMFWGPGYSIAHPGLFPHHPKADRFTPRQWVAFDYRGGWGTEAFERNVPADAEFPPPWDNAEDRIDGRRIIDQNLAKVQEKRAAAAMTLEAGIDVSDPIFFSTPRRGRPLRVGFRVSNISEGHNVPTGSLGAQPQLWLNVALVNPAGQRVWESGYLDSRGDLADMHSKDVAEGRVPPDHDLFNLQTKFLINNVRGTDRETPLPLNFSLDQLVFLRPGAVPVTVLNHPPLIRMEAHSIPPLDHRIARYRIPAEALRRPGVYRLSVRMRSRTEPIYFMRQIGSTPDMIRRMNENMIDIRLNRHTFRVP